MLYRLTADAILVVHAAYIAFVILGLVAVLAGGPLGWRWVRNPYFRAIHLLAIGLVVLQAYLDIVCPLTVWESRLRVLGGQQPYGAGGFIQTWLHRLIFFRAASWVFTLGYTLFGLLVAATLVLVPPRVPGWVKRRRHEPTPEPEAPSDPAAERREVGRARERAWKAPTEASAEHVAEPGPSDRR